MLALLGELTDARLRLVGPSLSVWRGPPADLEGALGTAGWTPVLKQRLQRLLKRSKSSSASPLDESKEGGRSPEDVMASPDPADFGLGTFVAAAVRRLNALQLYLGPTTHAAQQQQQQSGLLPADVRDAQRFMQAVSGLVRRSPLVSSIFLYLVCHSLSLSHEMGLVFVIVLLPVLLLEQNSLPVYGAPLKLDTYDLGSVQFGLNLGATTDGTLHPPSPSRFPNRTSCLSCSSSYFLQTSLLASGISISWTPCFLLVVVTSAFPNLFRSSVARLYHQLN